MICKISNEQCVYCLTPLCLYHRRYLDEVGRECGFGRIYMDEFYLPALANMMTMEEMKEEIGILEGIMGDDPSVSIGNIYFTIDAVKEDLIKKLEEEVERREAKLKKIY